MSERVDETLGWQPFGFGLLFGVVVPAALMFGVLVLLYRYLPRRRPGWHAALLGGAAAAIGLQGLQIGLGWYLAGPADFTEIYGSAAAIFVFLFSVYLSAMVFVICAILTGVADDAFGRPSVATSPARLPLAEFAYPGPLRDQLVAAILRGEKTTTTGLYEEYLREGKALEEPGDRSLVIDSDGRPVAVIETLEVELRRFADVGLQFAIDEGGAGDRRGLARGPRAVLHLAGDGRGPRRPARRDRRRYDRRLRDVPRRRGRSLVPKTAARRGSRGRGWPGTSPSRRTAPRNAAQPMPSATSRDRS